MTESGRYEKRLNTYKVMAHCFILGALRLALIVEFIAEKKKWKIGVKMAYGN